MSESKPVSSRFFGVHAERMEIPKMVILALVEEVVRVLADRANDPSLDPLREALDPVECLLFPELRDRSHGSKE